MGDHRADRRGRSRRPSTSETPAQPAQSSGKRRASKAPRGPLFRGLPSAPIVMGIAALAVSAGGAVTAAEPALMGSDSVSRVGAASALNGSGAVSTASLLDDRKAAVTRDSRRDALADAANAELLEAAEQQARQRDAALAKFAKKAEAQAAKIALNQWVLPLDNYRLTAEYGEYGLWASYHTGLDFAADSGTPLKAIANGTITSVGYDGAYGYKTVLTLEDGTELWYAHQDSYTVSEGQTVRAGEVIGYVGSTGNVTGPHLHLEVRPGAGDPVDPYAAFQVHGVTP
ncbi:M23 family metallopeptidase [Nocardioides sp. GCM10027113]|uniref:M23 family metallopeptidase n=1 Tax=unclassified Nocardioides TaxID=2615069 RepID=UPI00361890E1